MQNSFGVEFEFMHEKGSFFKYWGFWPLFDYTGFGEGILEIDLGEFFEKLGFCFLCSGHHQIYIILI